MGLWEYDADNKAIGWAAFIHGNDEIRAMLRSFIGRMTNVPPSVWGGVAATRFRDVVDRWNAESTKLHVALQGIAETMRVNERALREAAESHSHRIGAVGTDI